MEVGSVKRTEHVRRCREMWVKLEQFYANISKERDILEDILENKRNKNKLDTAEWNVRVPDLLLRECEQEIHQVINQLQPRLTHFFPLYPLLLVNKV